MKPSGNMFAELRCHSKLAAKRHPMYEKNRFGKYVVYFMSIFWIGYMIFFGEKKAVDIDSYTIHQGDMLGLAGNNGSGKTTLFRLILDLLKADQGKVTINNIDVSKSEDWKTMTGAFIDDGFLIDYLTPEEYFYFIGKMYNLRKEEVDKRLASFERFMNGEVIGQKKFIRNFSAGNKQKIGIISAMLHKPQLLILDEPFNFLDPSSQSIIKNLLKKYNEEMNATVLISSHNLNHTVDVCPRIALLEHGVIIRDMANESNSAEKELEIYFNVEVNDEETSNTNTPIDNPGHGPERLSDNNTES